MMYPLPNDALDDRLAFLGTAGSGKTYAAGTAVEKLLSVKARVVVIDPLGAWYGLRLQPDGKGAGFPIVIFGGAHGDLPLNEHHGALLGETAARMAESCIVDLSGIGTKAGERRFMLAFLTALYRHKPDDPLHVVFDEADLWAPQVIRDQRGEASKLYGMMETIIRRGRIKGFIPWLITQRPAVVAKDVLSQADGLVALKLTSSQDRDALDDWIAGQADKAEGRRIKAEMPTLATGQAVIWLPQRGVLDTRMFPRKATFDSSRTPKRGEAKRTLELKPLDLGALREKLSSVEAEAKANDPAALKAEIAKLKREMAGLAAKAATGQPAALASEEKQRYEAKIAELHQTIFDQDGIAFARGVAHARDGLTNIRAEIDKILETFPAYTAPKVTIPPPSKPGQQGQKPAIAPVRTPPTRNPVRQPVADAGAAGISLPPGERAVLTAAAQFGGVEREQLTVLTGCKILEVLIGAYPDAVARADLDDATGFKRSTRDAYLQRMKAKRLWTAEGSAVRASAELF